jgi:mycothiol synthase
MLSLRSSGLASRRPEPVEGLSLWTASTSPLSPASQQDAHVIAAFALVNAAPDTHLEGSPSHQASVEANLVVEPTSRGHGIARALAEAVLAAFPDAAISAWSHGNHPAAAALAPALGFDRARDLWIMRRSLADELPPVDAPASTVVRTFDPGRDPDAFLRVNAAAFASHPEQGDLTRADLEQRMAEPWFDPAGFFVAERSDGAELVGFHWTKVHEGDPAYGEVYVVGISPAAQGTGLGKVLTLAGLHHLRSLGLPEVILYVESDNAPAVAVYEGLGFSHAAEDTDVMYHRRTPR